MVAGKSCNSPVRATTVSLDHFARLKPKASEMLCNLASGIGRVAKAHKRQLFLNGVQAVGRAVISVGQHQQIVFAQDIVPLQPVHIQKRIGRDRQIRLFGAQQMLVIAALPGKKRNVFDHEIALRERHKGRGERGGDRGLNAHPKQANGLLAHMAQFGFHIRQGVQDFLRLCM